jgi:hypothetical protein
MFALGEGRYHIDSSLKDQHSHLCATSWDAEAALAPKEAAATPWLQPARVQPVEATVFGRHRARTRFGEVRGRREHVALEPRPLARIMLKDAKRIVITL